MSDYKELVARVNKSAICRQVSKMIIPNSAKKFTYHLIGFLVLYFHEAEVCPICERPK